MGMRPGCSTFCPRGLSASRRDDAAVSASTKSTARQAEWRRHVVCVARPKGEALASASACACRGMATVKPWRGTCACGVLVEPKCCSAERE